MPAPTCSTCPKGFTTAAAGAQAPTDCISECFISASITRFSLPAALYFHAHSQLQKALLPTHLPPTHAHHSSPSPPTVPICVPGTGGVGCPQCPYGTYSPGGTPLDPNTPCSPCPAGTYTPSFGTRSLSDCSAPTVANCNPGYYSRSGSCHLCPPGTYCEGGTRDVCKICPPGTVTMTYGSGSIDACKVPSGAARGWLGWVIDDCSACALCMHTLRLIFNFV